VTPAVDVLVIGGGPAGLAAAAAAAGGGARTLVLEREGTIGLPVRTSGVTLLSTASEFEIPAACRHPLRTARLVSPRSAATFNFGAPFCWVLDVTATYQYLARRAERAGATVETGVQVLAPLVQQGAVVGCRARDRSGIRDIHARIVIDAGGHRAEISKKAGLHPGFTRFGVGVEVEFVAPRCDQNEAVLVVGHRYAPAGYGWVLPWGRNRVRIGVGLLHADTRADPKRLVLELVRDADRFGVDLSDARAIEEHHGLIPAVGLAPRLVTDGLMAVGDAAGVATLVVGEGIRLSLVSGALAGRTAVEALRRGRTDARALRAYARALQRRFGVDLALGRLANRRMAAWTDDDWDDRLAVLARMPPPLMFDVLVSRFTTAAMARWLVRTPAMWPRVGRCAAGGLRQAWRRLRRSPSDAAAAEARD
jgi:digeranylgeranylglycerophospholipid reductase